MTTEFGGDNLQMGAASASLDIEQPDMLVAYLRQSGHISSDEDIESNVLYGGVSNRTVLVRRPNGNHWVIKQALSRLRVRSEWISDPSRVHREAAGLRCLARIAPESTTPFVFEDFDHHLLAMAAVPEPHENWKTQLLAGRIDLQHVRDFAALLARIHGFGCDQRESLASEFADRSFFESLRIEPYYEYSARRVPAAEPFLCRLIAECLDSRYTLVHGDYSPKNILLQDGRLILLDHEVIHFGDGTFDVGFAMTHLLSKAHHLPEHREAFVHAAGLFWQTYRDSMAEADAATRREDLERMCVRHTMGCLLARVAGRSPLEYMAEQQRDRQAKVVTALMCAPPAKMPDLIESFIERLA